MTRANLPFIGVLLATLLLITHDRSLAKRCDRIVSVADGRIVGPGAKRKVAAS
ncbi:hypothetical protein D3C83_141940 [compost metagenome]